MTVALKVDSVATELGAGSFVHAFFSTASALLENGKWGSRFPMLMHELYQGSLAKAHAEAALDELATIRRELAAFPPGHVVWDIEDRAARPPWGDNIAPTITNLSNYFVTGTGRDMFQAIEEMLVFLRDEGKHCTLTRLPAA
ncbi:immunity 70 family protein [Neorhizobium sp. DT-125]|uniref:immunity 70 family protein n=1 Tax=Neorhizobium sp. DT-125 TaxID=3396163 RepID=UPI003F1DECF9